MAADHVREGIRVNCVMPGHRRHAVGAGPARARRRPRRRARRARGAPADRAAWSAPRRSPRRSPTSATRVGLDDRHRAAPSTAACRGCGCGPNDRAGRTAHPLGAGRPRRARGGVGAVMETRELGSSGVRVTRLALGTRSARRPLSRRSATRPRARRCDAAWELGVRIVRHRAALRRGRRPSGALGAALRERPRDGARALHQGRAGCCVEPAAPRTVRRSPRTRGLAAPCGTSAPTACAGRSRTASRGSASTASTSSTSTTPTTTSTRRSARRCRRSPSCATRASSARSARG